VTEPQTNPVIRDPLLVGKNAPSNAYRADYEKRLAALIEETAQGYYKHLVGMQAAFHREFAPRAMAAMVGGFRSTAGFDILKKYDLGESRELTSSFAAVMGRTEHPITGPLVRLRKVSAENFAAQAPGILSAALADTKSPVNPLIAEALRRLKPKSLDEVALAYQAAFKKHRDKILPTSSCARSPAARARRMTPPSPSWPPSPGPCRTSRTSAP